MAVSQRIPVVAFLLTFAAHYVLQLAAWDIHIAARGGAGVADWLWKIVSLPLFGVAPAPLQNLYFDELLLANSVLWAAAAAWLSTLVPIERLLRRWTRRRAGPAASAPGWTPAPVHAQRPAAVDNSLDSVRRRAHRLQTTRTLGQGRYAILARIGGGAFGSVYRAHDTVRGLDVAIKVLDIHAVPREQRARFREAFRQEASLAGRLDHHGIVAVLDHDADAEDPYIVMPLVSGGTLRDRLDALPAGRHLSWIDVVEIGVNAAEALAYAHAHGVQAHRDIKPANLFRGDTGYKVGDFGIAQARAEQAQGGAGPPGGGTPGYMAPEQMLAPQSVDWHADLFSLCAVLYEALTGRLPYAAARAEHGLQAIECVVAAANTALTPLRELVDIPAHVAAAIERGLQFRSAKRFGSWSEFVQALRG